MTIISLTGLSHILPAMYQNYMFDVVDQYTFMLRQIVIYLQ